MFRVAQKVFITNEKGELLVVRWAANPYNPKELYGCWDFPGGGLEYKESLQEGLLREVREEIGSAVRIEVQEQFISWDFWMMEKPDQRCIVLGYKARWIDGKIVLNQEHDEYRWMLPSDLQNLPWSDEYKSVIKACTQYMEKHREGKHS